MTELTALLKLCDDPSPIVARKVAHRLRELDASEESSDLWSEIEAQNIVVSASQRAILETILAAPRSDSTKNEDIGESGRNDKLRAAWLEVFQQDDEARVLESALCALCDWQNGAGSGARGRLLLDELALEFGDFDLANSSSDANFQLDEAAALAKFLFEFKSLRGAPAEDYYNPLQSNLTVTLENGRGLPITLACIFILVGRRVGLSIEGCSFPGHFLARDAQSGRVFDAFNGGRTLSPHEISALQKAAPDEMSEAASAREIAARVLRNLSVAYYQNGETEKSVLMLSLLQSMDDDSLSDHSTRFQR
ncbi:Transglutaminase-like superfamily protein [Abditibacterium utsteinense]|uniref:Transglutaminase-like superfamily protein n=1 Tax=Abditibacterium utsteinense TaxID=1960156 RepID=A0A2S8SPL4_9BACT|nr:transglutaminase-like domain-containing protein [Abditibacterium utsteinense]PQV62740.1 Transglutaminase-like superfamily protein [Abditibacterium utsteinense]